MKSDDYVKITALLMLAQITSVYILMGNNGTVFMAIAIIMAAISGTIVKFGVDVRKNNKKKGSLTWADAVEIYGPPKIKRRQIKLKNNNEEAAKEFNND